MPEEPLPCPTPFEDYEYPGEAKEGQEHAEPITGYRAFLQAWFDWARQQKGGMSYRRFSDRAGLGNQPSALKNVILGRETLGPDRLEKFINAMRLSAEDAEMFRLLVYRDQARNDEERARWVQATVELRRLSDAKQIGRPGLSYAARWAPVAIRELVMMAGFHEDPDWIAWALRYRVTPGEAAEAVETLLRSGRLVRDEQGRLIAPADEDLVTTPPDGSGEHGLAHHRQMHALAGDMFVKDGDPLAPGSYFRSYCHYRSATLRLHPDDRKALHQYLERVQNEVLARFDKPSGRQVMQLNMHLFPLSLVLPEPEDE